MSISLIPGLVRSKVRCSPSLLTIVVNCRENARRSLVEALDSVGMKSASGISAALPDAEIVLVPQVRGKKILILDRKVSGFLGLIAEVPLLKEHGVDRCDRVRILTLRQISPGTQIGSLKSVTVQTVCRLLYLSEEPLQGIDVRSIVYLVRSHIENAQLIAQQILQTNK